MKNHENHWKWVESQLKKHKVWHASLRDLVSICCNEILREKLRLQPLLTFKFPFAGLIFKLTEVEGFTATNVEGRWNKQLGGFSQQLAAPYWFLPWEHFTLEESASLVLYAVEKKIAGMASTNLDDFLISFASSLNTAPFFCSVGTVIHLGEKDGNIMLGIHGKLLTGWLAIRPLTHTSRDTWAFESWHQLAGVITCTHM